MKQAPPAVVRRKVRRIAAPRGRGPPPPPKAEKPETGVVLDDSTTSLNAEERALITAQSARMGISASPEQLDILESFLAARIDDGADARQSSRDICRLWQAFIVCSEAYFAFSARCNHAYVHHVNCVCIEPAAAAGAGKFGGRGSGAAQR